MNHSKLSVALVTTAPPDRPNSMTIYADMVERALTDHSDKIRLQRFDLLAQTPSIHSFSARSRGRLTQLWLLSVASRKLAQARADVFHLMDGSYAHVLRTLPPRRAIVTVHDLIPALQVMKRFPVPPPGPAARWLIQRNLSVLRRQQWFCADSASTAQDLQLLLGSCSDAAADIRVIPPALRASLLSRQPPRPLPWLARCDNGIRTVLHVGNNGFYKNRSGVLSVFARLAVDCKLHLVLAGELPDEAIFREISRRDLCDRVDIVVNPDDATLACLYERASLMLFPSLYEGFGWPPLEAMAFGCPVVCSDAGSLPEVVGDAALQAPPDDHDAMVRHCRSVFDNPARAAAMIESGFHNIGRFSEARLAEGLLALYETAARGSAEAA